MFFRKKREHTLLEDIEISSQWLEDIMEASGYHADYSIESLKEIDRFIIEEDRAGGILSKDIGKTIFALGAYVGKVFIKEYGGHWITNDKDRKGEMKIIVELDNDISFMPVMSVMKYYSNHEETSLYVLSLAIEQSSQE